MYTRHGHHITGTSIEEPIPAKARCGGPGLCSDCSKDAAAASVKMEEILIETSGIEPDDTSDLTVESQEEYIWHHAPFMGDSIVTEGYRYTHWTPTLPDAPYGPIYCSCLDCGAMIMGFPCTEEIQSYPDFREIHDAFHNKLNHIAMFSNTIGLGGPI